MVPLKDAVLLVIGGLLVGLIPTVFVTIEMRYWRDIAKIWKDAYDSANIEWMRCNHKWHELSLHHLSVFQSHIEAIEAFADLADKPNVPSGKVN